MLSLVAFWIIYITAPILLWTLARWLGNRPATASTDPAATRCGRCGYDVRALPTNVCPECGSDLDLVGRRTSSQLTRQRWLRRLAPIVFTSLMLFAAFLFAMAALFSFSPRRQVGRMVSPRVAFIGNVEARWPFTIVDEAQWDRDESPHVFGNWYAEREQVDRLSSNSPRPEFVQATSLNPIADPALKWDSHFDRWSCASALLVDKTGEGFPPVAVLRTWAGDIVTRHPPPRPLTDTEMKGLVVAIGDLLASSDARRVGPKWTADRATLTAAGATNVTLARFGGSFRNDIIPFWPPAAMIAFEWLVMTYLCWLSLLRLSDRPR